MQCFGYTQPNLERPCGFQVCFWLGYGLQRFLVEFARQPDAHLNYVALDWMTQGQLLSLPMVAIGAYLLVRKTSIKG